MPALDAPLVLSLIRTLEGGADDQDDDRRDDGRARERDADPGLITHANLSQ